MKNCNPSVLFGQDFSIICITTEFFYILYKNNIAFIINVYTRLMLLLTEKFGDKKF